MNDPGKNPNRKIQGSAAPDGDERQFNMAQKVEVS